MEEKNKTLKERMVSLRSTTDYKLPLKSYVMVCIDGRSFSKLIKNSYEKPFDDKFINMMNEVTKYVCKNVSGCKFAYVQSDEITFVLTDFETETTQPFFGNRLTKILSIIPSMASAKFNQMVYANLCDLPCSNGDLKQIILGHKLAEFDCKAWAVHSLKDVYAYYLWRQIDCIRNSKQQTAQTWLNHKQLDGLTTDEQIKKLLEEKGIDWNEYDDGKKYGRFIYKETEDFYNSEINMNYVRSVWKVHPAFPIMGEEGKKKFLELNIIPDIDYIRPDEQVEEDLLSWIKGFCYYNHNKGLSDYPFSKSTSFRESLGFGDTDILEFTKLMETKYSVKISTEQFTEINTIGDLERFLKSNGVAFNKN